MTDHALFRSTLRHLSRGMVFTAVLSCFVNLLMLIVPLYTMQVYDRVMTSRSTDTLIMLAIVAVGGLMLYAVLDYIRTRVFLIMGDVIGRRLNVPTLEAAVIDTLHGTSKNSTQAIRDLNDLRSFVTGSAITVPLELMWVPLFLIVLFLLHTVYGWLALGAAALPVPDERADRRADPPPAGAGQRGRRPLLQRHRLHRPQCRSDRGDGHAAGGRQALAAQPVPHDRPAQPGKQRRQGAQRRVARPAADPPDRHDLDGGPAGDRAGGVARQRHGGRHPDGPHAAAVRAVDRRLAPMGLSPCPRSGACGTSSIRRRAAARACPCPGPMAG